VDHSDPPSLKKPPVWRCLMILRTIVLVVLIAFAAYLLTTGHTLSATVAALAAVSGAAGIVSRRVLPAPNVR
jgi:hypothetical protein